MHRDVDKVRAQTHRHPGQPDDITKGYALAEIRRFRGLYPSVPPEVAAIGMIRRAGTWREISSIEAALNEILKEDDSAT